VSDLETAEIAPGVASAPSWGDPRTKTVCWYDPRVVTDAGRQISGREQMEAIRDGRLPRPPIAALFGFAVAEVGDGEVRFELTPDESMYNPIGAIHGGVVCTLLDTVVGCAFQTTLPAGTGYTSIELKVSYLRPIQADGGVLTGHGWVTKRGRRVGFAEGDVRDADGKVVATGSGSLLVLAAA
jgi:uncharacterized protein (TIGR00369 family)